MPLHNRQLAVVGLLVVALSALVLGGCSGKAASTSALAAPEASTAIANLTQMTAADKTSQIASGFPIQVPVAAGSVVRGEAQGDSAWVYQIIVSGTLPAVRNWYLQAYQNAEWTVTSSTGSEITLEKGSAQSRLKFEKVDNGNEARTQITAVVGVGTPVLQTQ